MGSQSNLGSRSFYKPLASRTPVLFVYLLATLALLAMLELAIQRIPNHRGIGIKYSTASTSSKRNLEPPSIQDYNRAMKRQVSSIAPATTAAFASPTSTGALSVVSVIGTLAAEGISPGLSTSSIVASSRTTDGNHITPGSGATSTSSPGHRTTILGTTNGEHIDPNKAPKTMTTTNGEHINPGGSTMASTNGEHLNPGGSTMASTSGEHLSPGTTVAPGATQGENVKPTAGPAVSVVSTREIVQTTVPTTRIVVTSVANVQVVTSLRQAVATSLVVSTGWDINGNPTLVTRTSTSAFSEAVALTVSSYSLISSTVVGSQVITSTASGLLTITGPAVPTATIVNGKGTFLAMNDGTLVTYPYITWTQYYLVSFVPMIVAIIYTFPWRILHNTIAYMEPFYQLARSEGALAENSILLDYSTSYFITIPFKSIYRGHFYMFWSSLINLAVLVLAPLSSTVLFVSTYGQCGPSDRGGCYAAWAVYVDLARVMEAILAFIAVLTILMIGFNFSRKSGVYGNPLNIAGLGALFQNAALQHEFRSLDSRLSNKALAKQLAGCNYKLEVTSGFDGVPCYGIAPVRYYPPVGYGDGSRDSLKGQYGVVSINELHTDDPLMMRYVNADSAPQERLRFAGFYDRALLIGTFLALAGLFVIVAYYRWTSVDSAFERFMDSEGFGVRFLMATFGVIIKLSWSTIFEDLRDTEHYRRLLRGSARATDSVLVYTYMSPVSALFPSLMRKHFLVFTVSFIALVSEVLPIALANTPFSRGAPSVVYWSSPIVCIAILPVMLLLLLILIFRPSHDLYHLPRKPTTVASELLYLATSEYAHEGGLLHSLAGLDLVSDKERDNRVKGMGRLYGLGQVKSGALRIDEEDRIQRGELPLEKYDTTDDWVGY